MIITQNIEPKYEPTNANRIRTDFVLGTKKIIAVVRALANVATLTNDHLLSIKDADML